MKVSHIIELNIYNKQYKSREKISLPQSDELINCLKPQ